ncbi:NADH:ubiquinone oxidoreductase, partial [Modicella reniformis]
MSAQVGVETTLDSSDSSLSQTERAQFPFASVAEELEYYKSYAKKVEEELEESQYALEEFQQSSRELEEELEKEVESTERRYNEIRIRNEAMRQEVQEWKEKYQQAIKESNANISQLTRQLDALKQQTEMFVKKERALEQDNDDLERTERATKWSLQELELKYNATLEKTVILENEVSAKTALVDQVQRLKDELRDANVELAVIKANQTPKISVSSGSLNSDAESTPIGSTNEAMPSLRARLAKNATLQQRTTSKDPSPTANIPTSEAVSTQNSVKAVQDMVGRVK